MKLLSNDEIETLLDDIIHAPSQKEQSNSFDLTLKEVHAVTEGGSLDFGGSEFEEAMSNLIPPVKKTDDAKYGWWALNRGEYLIHFNETFKTIQEENKDLLILLLPLDRIHKAGVRIEPKIITENHPTALMSIQTDGVEIKENARVATVVIFAK